LHIFPKFFLNTFGDGCFSPVIDDHVSGYDKEIRSGVVNGFFGVLGFREFEENIVEEILSEVVIFGMEEEIIIEVIPVFDKQLFQIVPFHSLWFLHTIQE